MATINGVEVIGDKSAHDFDLLDKNDGVNLANGVERNRKSAEDNHEDIVRHRTDTDVHVTPAWKNSLVTKEILGLYWTAAQTADIINEISIAGGAKLVKVDALPAVGLEQTIYLVPKQDPQAGDVFDEYVWVDGKFEFIGTTKVDLSNYATKTELNAKQDALSNQQIQNIADVTNKANDADVVHKSGNESINGDKTFTSSVKLKSNTIDNTVTPTTNLFKNLYVTDKNDVALSSLYYAQRTNNNREFNLQVSHPDSNDVLNLNLVHDGNTRNAVFQGNNFVPNLSNSKLGTPTNKWADVNTVLLNGKTPETIEEQGDGYIRYSNGIQLCWGVAQGEATGIMAYPRPFIPNTHVYVVGSYIGGNASKILCFADKRDGVNVEYEKSANVWADYHAIGKWK